ncbi:MAG: hypothetical protein DMG70_03395 [Acidobacteria bacterium]|nr:MAG: hypothetical protein DMG70_03395 [Acidobacteriota bacterium]
MKTFLLALFLCFSVGIVAVARDSPILAPLKHQAARIRSTSIMGTVSEHGEKLRFVTDQRAWKVDNPETLKGHEGHYVRVNAHIYADKDSIHITEVKMPTASESRKNDAQ